MNQNNHDMLYHEEEEINIKEIFQTLMKGKWIILLSFILVTAVTIWYTFSQTPIYEASTQILIGAAKNQTAAIFDVMTPLGNSQMEINNEVEILKSRSLAESTIANLMENYSPDSLYILGKGQEEKVESIFNQVKRWILLLGNRDVEDEKWISTREDTIRTLAYTLQEAITITPERNTQTIRISIKSPDPQEAAIIANTFAYEYYKQDLERSRGAMSEVKSFIQEQLEQVEERLRVSEDSLRAFQQQEGVVNLDEASKNLLEQLANFESEYYSAMAELGINEQQLKYLTRELDIKEKELLNNFIQTANPLILELQTKIAKLEASVVEAIAKGIDENAPQIQTIKVQMDKMKERLNEETRMLISRGYIPGPSDPLSINQSMLEDVIKLRIEQILLQSKAKEFKKLVDYYSKELEKLPQVIITFTRLERERLVNENIYMLMKNKYEESRITEASQISNVYVIDQSVPPKYPVSPKKKMNVLLGGFLGLGLGIGIIFLKEFLDNTIKTKEDLVKKGITTLAIIPEIDEIKATKKARTVTHTEISQYQSRLITHFDPKSPVSEAYRSMRTNIELSGVDKPIKSVVITSAGPGEGKSTTIANLAIAFAQMEQKTLLVDTDMRRPVLQKVFKVPRVPGIADVITGSNTLEECIHKTSVENLYILPSGNLPPNPSEMLGSKKMREIYQTLSGQYDKIFFDAPPIIAVTDASLLARLCDGLVVVVKSGVTHDEALDQVQNIVQQIKLPLLGAVINAITPKHMKGGSYYYYYRYMNYQYK
ncbi:MAG: protein-tyrosine kinase [Candidatus Marinimicrobia bacterium]|nr:protein-tyrosine kinase [Candidatus Neomarinimicrobiota bacterium]